MSVDYQFKKDFNEYDPAKKDEAWANRLVTQFRYYMQPLVTMERAVRNRSYLLGEQSVEKYKAKFFKPEKLPFEFIPLGVFEKTRNILTAEREKAGIYLQLNALDPTAQEEKEYDKKLLANSSFIEELLSYAQLSIGLPAYQLGKDKSVEGDKISKGNLETFKEMGLDPNSPQDIAYFFQTHYRIDVEIEGEDAVNFFVHAGELQEHIKEWCDDVIAVKAIAGRAYANEVTCAPDFKYLKPEYVKWVRGQRRDGKDARAIMSEEDMTIAELLAFAACDITADNVMEIIDSVNMTNATHYTGLAHSDGSIFLGTGSPGSPSVCSYDSFLSMKVGVGYIEWKSINVDTRKIGRNALGNTKLWAMPYEWEPAEKNGSYKKESLWNVTTYKAYFICRSTTEQTLFKFGKLFDQVTYGAEDEYSSFSFQVYQQPGQSAVEISIPFIDNIHDAWFRFCWILNKAKPRGTRYNYNVIAKIATKMYGKDTEENGVMKVIEMFQQSIDDFYVNDAMNPNLGGGQNPHFDKPNGLDKDAIATLYKVFQDQHELISDKLGINAIREAYSPNPNDGYKLQMQTLAQSRNATEYMSRMIMSLLNNYAKHTLSIVQDMIAFKGSKGYENIERALGIKSIRSLRVLKRMPIHKFGIFVESFNTDLERQEQKKEAADAWQKGEISYQVYMLVRSIDNYKKAAQVLAYEKGKEIQRKQDEQKLLHDQQMAQIAASHKAKMEEIKGEWDGKLEVQKEANIGSKDVAEIMSGSHLKGKEMNNDAEPMKAAVRADSKIRQDEAAARIKRGEPVETAEV